MLNVVWVTRNHDPARGMSIRFRLNVSTRL